MFSSKDIFLTPPSGGYTIGKSVRLRSSASAYLNRTFSTPTSNYKFTYSFWVKRGILGTDQTFLGVAAGSSGNTGATPRGAIDFDASTNTASIFSNDGGSTVMSVGTTAVYRDPSAWYHFVWAIDTTQATSTNRVILYVNGVSQTLSGTFPTQNVNTIFNGTSSSKFHAIGMYSNLAQFVDGYITEVNFIDGQALTPSSFGSTNTLTGVWQPAKYTGTYGTNGFYLNFSSNGSSAALGTDFSGNSNTWTVNNISVTAGATYDSMTDVPTLTSATAANYAVLNPLKLNSSTATLSDGNLKVTFPNGGAGGIAMSTISMNSGKFYWEITVGGTDGATQPKLGVLPISTFTESSASLDIATYGYAYSRNGTKWIVGVNTAYGASFTTGDVIGFALDMTAGTLVCYKNNTSQGTLASGITGDMAAGLTAYNGYAETINFGQQPFVYTPPTGYVALNTYNLPTSTITNGAAYMAATLYTGTSGNVSVVDTVNGIGFQPDFIWVKARSNAQGHSLVDAVRGTTSLLQSNTTSAELTLTNPPTFNSNGFTSTTDIHTNGYTYVAWQWKAGGTSSSNTNGSITSTVSVGATQGFSVVTYTGTLTAGTVGHGLGVAPSMIIAKSRNNAVNWITYHVSTGKDAYMNLNTTNASASLSNYWGTSVNSSTFGFLSNAFDNANGNMVAYCFAAVAGYSAFGSYTGNGSADGPFVYLGFRPRFVMLKRTDSANDWFIIDTSRNTYNVAGTALYPNSSSSETSNGFYDLDVLSNGFKAKTTNAVTNASGGTYIYACFAENPFKNALAR